jgi:hypothetical protein
MGARFAYALAGGVLLILAAAACGQDDGRTNSSDGTIVRGVVRDASDGSRIKNAKVFFRSDARDQADDRTNEDGEFVMTVFSRSDTGRIEARKAGFSASVVSVYLDDGDVAIDVDLEPN